MSGELPIPYGWYCVGYGAELVPGELRRLRYFGEDLVLFRTLAGRASLTGAHCPHLGAHLGFGRIDADGLHCPFHDWTFDADGYCVRVPYAKRIPAAVRERPGLRVYPLVELNGFLWAWYHPHGVDPLFPLHEFEELSSGAWTDYEKYEWHVGTHIQESGENAVDSAHFVYVHKVGEVLAEPDVTFEGHKRVSDLALELIRFTESGRREGEKFIDGRVLTISSGPGQTWTRQLGVADLLILGLATPVERNSIHLRFACSVPRSQAESRETISRMVIDHAVQQVEQDIPIWEHKTYLDRPILCDGDGPIGAYRKWFRQFYAV